MKVDLHEASQRAASYCVVPIVGKQPPASVSWITLGAAVKTCVETAAKNATFPAFSPKALDLRQSFELGQ
jgi:hypothetical protein